MQFPACPITPGAPRPAFGRLQRCADSARPLREEDPGCPAQAHSVRGKAVGRLLRDSKTADSVLAGCWLRLNACLRLGDGGEARRGHGARAEESPPRLLRALARPGPVTREQGKAGPFRRRFESEPLCGVEVGEQQRTKTSPEQWGFRRAPVLLGESCSVVHGCAGFRSLRPGACVARADPEERGRCPLSPGSPSLSALGRMPPESGLGACEDSTALRCRLPPGARTILINQEPPPEPT